MITNEHISGLISKIDELTSDFEKIDDAKGWISPCGHCTACRGNNNNWYEYSKRIGDDFAFAGNGCYKKQLLHWKNTEYPMELAYYNGEEWVPNSKLKKSILVDILKECFEQIKKFAKSEENINKERLEFINKVLE